MKKKKKARCTCARCTAYHHQPATMRCCIPCMFPLCFNKAASNHDVTVWSGYTEVVLHFSANDRLNGDQRNSSDHGDDTIYLIMMINYTLYESWQARTSPSLSSRHPHRANTKAIACNNPSCKEGNQVGTHTLPLGMHTAFTAVLCICLQLSPKCTPARNCTV